MDRQKPSFDFGGKCESYKYKWTNEENFKNNLSTLDTSFAFTFVADTLYIIDEINRMAKPAVTVTPHLMSWLA